MKIRQFLPDISRVNARILDLLDIKHMTTDWQVFTIGTARYVYICLTDLARFVTGKGKRRIGFEDVYFRARMLNALTIRNNYRITCVSDGAGGAGSQAWMIMWAIAFARASGMKYCHTPFTFIDHADRPMKEWVSAWESHFNLGLGEEFAEPSDKKIVDYHSIAFAQGKQVHCKEIDKSFEDLLPEFRRRYYHNKCARKNDTLVVALHIRRGDATVEHPYLWQRNEGVVSTVELVVKALKRCGFAFKLQVYSEGSIDDFSFLSEWDAEFFLDQDAIWTMQELIEADVLIAGRGMFSYVSALLSDGVVLFEPWLRPLPGWIVVDSNGLFNVKKFLACVREVGSNTQERSCRLA
jgi:hypothetical protein